MISAKLYMAGGALRLYFLAVDGGSEVRDFLDERSRSPVTAAVASGSIYMLRHLADEGLRGLPASVFKSWRLGGEMFHEIRKGKHRISCFVDPGSILLLTTTFRTFGRTEDFEYARALRLKRTFDSEGTWED